MRFCQDDDCGRELPEGRRGDAAYCSPACRQRAYRRRLATELSDFGNGASERRLQEAELINNHRLVVRDLLDPAKVSALSPKARDLLVETFEEVVHSIRNARADVTDRGRHT